MKNKLNSPEQAIKKMFGNPVKQLDRIFDFSDVLGDKVSECCGARVTETGFCTDCKDNAVGETQEEIQDQEQKYGEPHDQADMDYKNDEVRNINAK